MAWFLAGAGWAWASEKYKPVQPGVYIVFAFLLPGFAQDCFLFGRSAMARGKIVFIHVVGVIALGLDYALKRCTVI